MFASLPSRAIGAAALAGALLISGCSSESDVPPVVASSPDGGTQMNTDTGSGGTFPDVNTVPTTRPTSTIQDLVNLPDGLSGATNGTQYGEPLVGGPSSAADRPAPPPPPVEELPPIAEPEGKQTQGSEVPEPSATDAVAEVPVEEAAVEEAPAEEAPVEEAVPEEPAASEEPLAPAPTAESAAIQAPEIVEPEMPEPQAVEAAPAPEVAEPEMPEPPVAEAPPAPEVSQPEVPQVADAAPADEVEAAQYGDSQPAPEGELGTAAAAEAQPEPPLQPETQLAMVPTPPAAPQAPAAAQPTEQPFYSAQALYRSPYGTGQQAPTNAGYGEPPAGDQPLALIYFDSGSSNLSPDDRNVLRQIAEMQRNQGGIVHIIGHASMRSDSTDPEHQQINQDISEARAGIVAQQLIEYGVPQEAITTVAVGDSQPLFSESGEAGNRRAEVYLSAN